jgi:hypothetical protein
MLISSVCMFVGELNRESHGMGRLRQSFLAADLGEGSSVASAFSPTFATVMSPKGYLRGGRDGGMEIPEVVGAKRGGASRFRIQAVDRQRRPGGFVSVSLPRRERFGEPLGARISGRAVGLTLWKLEPRIPASGQARVAVSPVFRAPRGCHARSSESL